MFWFRVPVELVSLQVIWLVTSGLWRVREESLICALFSFFFSHQGRSDILLALYFSTSKMEVLKTLKFEFHIIFTCHKILFFFWLFHSFKNVKTIVTSLAVLKQSAGWIWLTGGSMPTFDLRDLMLVYGWSCSYGEKSVEGLPKKVSSLWETHRKDSLDSSLWCFMSTHDTQNFSSHPATLRGLAWR